MMCDVLPYYGVSHQQEERQQTLLLRRRKRPCWGQAPHRAADLPWNCGPISRFVEGTHGSYSVVSYHTRVRSARSAVVGRSALRSLGCAEDHVARTTIGTLYSALPVAGRHPPDLSAGTKDGGCGLVSVDNL